MSGRKESGRARGRDRGTERERVEWIEARMKNTISCFTNNIL